MIEKDLVKHAINIFTTHLTPAKARGMVNEVLTQIVNDEFQSFYTINSLKWMAIKNPGNDACALIAGIQVARAIMINMGKPHEASDTFDSLPPISSLLAVGTSRTRSVTDFTELCEKFKGTQDIMQVIGFLITGLDSNYHAQNNNNVKALSLREGELTMSCDKCQKKTVQKECQVFLTVQKSFNFKKAFGPQVCPHCNSVAKVQYHLNMPVILAVRLENREEDDQDGFPTDGTVGGITYSLVSTIHQVNNHFVTFIKRQAQWIKCDEDKITECRDCSYRAGKGVVLAFYMKTTAHFEMNFTALPEPDHQDDEIQSWISRTILSQASDPFLDQDTGPASYSTPSLQFGMNMQTHLRNLVQANVAHSNVTGALVVHNETTESQMSFYSFSDAQSTTGNLVAAETLLGSDEHSVTTPPPSARRSFSPVQSIAERVVERKRDRLGRVPTPGGDTSPAELVLQITNTPKNKPLLGKGKKNNTMNQKNGNQTNVNQKKNTSETPPVRADESAGQWPRSEENTVNSDHRTRTKRFSSNPDGMTTVPNRNGYGDPDKRKKSDANELIDQTKEGGRTERQNPAYKFFLLWY